MSYNSTHITARDLSDLGGTYNPRTRRYNATYLALLAGLLASITAPAQQAPHYLLEETTIHSGAESTFEPAQRDYCAAVARGGAPECIVYSPTTFSPAGEFLTLIAFTSFSHYDQGTYTSKGLSPEQAATLQQRRGPTISANRESALTLVPEVSYNTPAAAPLALITDLTIAPGTLPALLRYIRAVELPAAHSAHVTSFNLYQVVAGAATNRFLLIRGLNTFAQMDNIQPFGDTPTNSPTKAQLARPSIANCVQQVRTTIMRMRTDLSAPH